MKVSEITKQLGYDYIGDDVDVNGVKYYQEATEQDLAIAFRRRDIEETKAMVVLTKPVIINTNKTLIMACDDINLAMVKICQILVRENVIYMQPCVESTTISPKGYRMGKNCSISEKTLIDSSVVIGNDVSIAPECVIEPYTIIGSGTVLEEGVHVGAGCKIGAESFYHYYGDNNELLQFSGCGKAIIQRGTHIGNNTIVQRGTLSDTLIGEFCVIGNSIDIGHDVKIGTNCKIVSQTGIAGGVNIGNDVMIYGQCGISNNIQVGNNVIVKGKTLVSKSINDGEIVFGLFGRSSSDELKLAAKIRKFFNGKEE